MEPKNPTQAAEAHETPANQPHEHELNATVEPVEATTETLNTAHVADTAANDETNSTAVKVGDEVTATITKHVHQMVFVTLENGSEAYINANELRDVEGEISITLGAQIKAKVNNLRGGIELTRDYLLTKQELDRLEVVYNSKATIQGKVTGTNKGGFDVRIGSLSAFCPRSHFSLRPERAPQQQIGKVLDFVIEELKRDKKLRIVVTRRPILEAAERERAQLMAGRFNVDDVIEGRVSQLSKFGAFIDVGDGIEGLIPMSELSHGHVNRASDVIKNGETVQVKVISIDAERGRLSLSIKRLSADPWLSFVDQYELGSTITGKVVRLTDFGAFVELAPSVEGLLHISSITTQGRLNHPSERLSEGQELEVVIEEVVRNGRKDRRKIRLVTQEVAERRKPIDIKISVDEVITAPVKETNDRGVTLAIASNLDGFIPAAETGTQRGVNLQELFPVGKEVQAKVMNIELRKAKVRLSIKALENHEEQQAFKQFKAEMKSDQSRMSSTFGDLLKNFN